MTPFKQTALWDDVQKIIYASRSSGFYEWKLEFKIEEGAPIDLQDPDLAQTEREREGFFEAWRTPNFDFISNYESSNFEAVTVTCLFTLGMWLKVLYPARRFLTAVITRKKLIGKDDAEDDNEEPWIIERKVFITPGGEQIAAKSPMARLTRKELDLRDVFSLEIELLDPATEQVSQIAVGGNYRNCLAADVMLALFQKALSDVNINGEPAVSGYDVIDGRCETVREHVVVDQGTPLLRLPAYLQHKAGGIWSTGIGHFFQHGTWWFYPLFDTTRFDKTAKTLTIIKVPSGDLPVVENSIMVDGDKVKIISTDVQGQVDDTDTKYLTQGDGVRFANSEIANTTWVETKDNKVITRRGNANSEIRIDDKVVQKHYTRMSANRFTSNALVEYSQLASRAGYIATVVWDNADQLLLYPNMPCKILELVEDEVKETEGVLLNAQASIQIHDKALSANSHKTTIVLSIFCSTKNQLGEDDA